MLHIVKTFRRVNVETTGFWTSINFWNRFYQTLYQPASVYLTTLFYVCVYLDRSYNHKSINIVKSKRVTKFLTRYDRQGYQRPSCRKRLAPTIFKLRIALFVHNIQNEDKGVPDIFLDALTPASEIRCHNTRYALSQNLYRISTTRRYGQSTFQFSASKIW